MMQRSLAQQGAIPHIVKGLRHPDFDTRECAAAALGNLAAGNASIMDGEGQKVPIIRLMEGSVPQLVHLCRSSHSGQAADCAGDLLCHQQPTFCMCHPLQHCMRCEVKSAAICGECRCQFC